VAVIDEAQNIKNSSSAQTKAIKSIKADHRIAMTGTPVENRLLDYWSIIDYVMKGYLGSKAGFKEGYAVPIERYRDRAALERFRRLTSPLILRRLKTDRSIIGDLPEKVITNRFPALTTEQAVLYQQLVEHTDDWLANTEGIGRSGIVFKLMTGLKQICCHPRLYNKQGSRQAEASGKSAALLELLQTIAERGEKALIFTQFAEMGELLKEIIESSLELPCLFFHGGSSKKAREEMVDLFQNDPDRRFMVLSIKAGGVGLNLTAANHVIHYDLWWNPAVENQATDRAFRIGQRKDVTVYRFITRGTFEEKINSMLEAKKELADLTVSEGEQRLTKMSTGDLKELIELSEG
jgi:SNF2 family DNA or RNA helicase